MGLGEVLEDEKIQAMINAIADARVDLEAAAEAQAEFENFIAEIEGEAVRSAGGSFGENA